MSSTLWSRDAVASCYCSALRYVHSHCPCHKCNGKAVSRATEYRHWKEANMAHTCITHAQSSTTEVMEVEPEINYEADSVEDTYSSTSVFADSSESTTATINDTVTTTNALVDNDGDDEGLQQQPDHEPRNTLNAFGKDIDSDIVTAVLRAFAMVDNMGESKKSMLQILEFGRDCYCKGDSVMSKKWPSSWSACMNTLRRAGYKDPITYYICLNASHPNLWSISDDPQCVCRYCNGNEMIQFHYLSLVDKVRRWCSDEMFCAKMTAHWRDRQTWLYGRNNGVYKEIWDGSRFAELRWFWDPQEEWLLPTRCTFCKEVISANNILESLDVNGQTSDHEDLHIICPYCATQFHHHLQYTRGDPRNIALIGHWDGWQPFSTSAKHSCGKVGSILRNYITTGHNSMYRFH